MSPAAVSFFQQFFLRDAMFDIIFVYNLNDWHWLVTVPEKKLETWSITNTGMPECLYNLLHRDFQLGGG